MAKFGGSTYDALRDRERLFAQLARVKAAMNDGGWHTLPELAQAVNAPEQSVSARLRDLRKEKFGGRTVERQYVKDGLHRYRLAPPGPTPQLDLFP